MSESPLNSHLEAWKSLLELIKITISINATILTALIGFLAVNQLTISTKLNYIAPSLLTLSILIAIYGFGRAIHSIKNSNSIVNSILLTNISIFLMVIGIISILLIDFDKKNTLDNILLDIQKETKSLKTKISPDYLIKFEAFESNYILTYKIDNQVTLITYSTAENRIIALE